MIVEFFGVRFNIVCADRRMLDALRLEKFQVKDLYSKKYDVTIEFKKVTTLVLPAKAICIQYHETESWYQKNNEHILVNNTHGFLIAMDGQGKRVSVLYTKRTQELETYIRGTIAVMVKKVLLKKGTAVLSQSLFYYKDKTVFMASVQSNIHSMIILQQLRQHMKGNPHFLGSESVGEKITTVFVIQPWNASISDFVPLSLKETISTLVEKEKKSNFFLKEDLLRLEDLYTVQLRHAKRYMVYVGTDSKKGAQVVTRVLKQ